MSDKNLHAGSINLAQEEGSNDLKVLEYRGKTYRTVALPGTSDFFADREILKNKLRRKIYSPEYLTKKRKEHAELTCIFIAILTQCIEKDPAVLAGEENFLKGIFECRFSKTSAKPRKKKVQNYPHLEDSSHGILTENIVVPDWHPQKNFLPKKFGFAIECLQQGYKFMVNIVKGSVELVDDISFLLAAKEMGITFPPLSITKISFIDVCMYQCYLFIKEEISEWQKYLLIKSMLEHSKTKMVAKMLEMSEHQLGSFLRQGQKIESMTNDGNFFENLVEKKIKLKDATI